MKQNDLCDFLKIIQRLQNLGTLHHMVAHNTKFFVSQPVLLLQDMVRHSDLTHVVQVQARHQDITPLPAQVHLHLFGRHQTQFFNAFQVTVRVSVTGMNFFGQ